MLVWNSKKQLAWVFRPTTERTTPSFLAFLDEASLAGNVSFVDDDLDRHEHLGNAPKKTTNVESGRGRCCGKKHKVEGGPRYTWETGLL